MKYLSPTKDIVFKSMWLRGNEYVRKYLERMVEYSIGHKLEEYTIGSNEAGIISYESIANKVDVLLVSKNHKSKINVEMNRLEKRANINNINSVNNKSNVYLGIFISNFYNDLPEEERYKERIKVEQVNFNTFYCEENKLIHELHFEFVDKNYDITKNGIKSHQIYLPRMVELCYDREEEIYRDFQLLMSTTYEEMETIAKGNKEREEVVKFLKRLGADTEFMAAIDREEYNRIQQEITFEYEKELAIKEGLQQGIEQGIEQGIQQGIEQGIQQNKIEMIKSLYNNGIKDLQLLSSSSNLSLDEIKKILEIEQ